MGEETIGNKPLNGLNYIVWPNIMPVANQQSRVYHTWVNGDEMFYFQSTSAQLNELLDDFSKLQSKTKEVVILPQADDVRSFDQAKVAAAEKAIKSIQSASEEKNATTFTEKETRFRDQARQAEEFINRQRGL